MSVYAISDLHLSFANPKPMDIFGPVWENYVDKLRQNWDEMVTPDDIVLLPGDLSWAMRLSGAMADLKFVHQRPGRKILTRGNHDLWWQRQATTRMQRTLDKKMIFLQGTSVVMDGIGITGTRGWRTDWEMNPSGEHISQPEGAESDPQADKIYKRELSYLEKGLQSIPESVDLKIAMLHFPPFDVNLGPNEFAHLLSAYKVDYLVYGHIHLGLGTWIDGEVEGVKYRMVSADVVDFKPQLIVK